MDAHLAGGVASSELLIWLAGYGQGKTSYMINQGVTLAEQGKSVLHISLEISQAKCYQRMDQKLTGLDRDERLANPKTVMAARRSLPGHYYVKDWSHAKITVDDIKALVKRMRAKGQKVDVIFVDYLKLMKPTTLNRHGERFNHSEVTIELRALASELEIPIITAWQVNRTGYEKQVIDATDIAECWDVIHHADIILGLNQNHVEREEKVLRVNVIKQRESTARPLEYYYSDLDRMIVKEAKGQGNADEDPEEVGDRG
jgi:replicative DNA helicase